ncbi:MAG: hypothetical protein KDC26_06855 [Armatimonadetes bacterium]|nr:hypothetical protein [Armatimonadota bacterium]
MPEESVGYRYAEFPSVKLYETKSKKTPLRELLFGDWINVKEDVGGGWFKVRCRGTDGFMRKEDFREDKILEVVFLDVGQGDGCFLVTPKDEFLIIDAGEGNHMARYLQWRFSGFKKIKRKFDAAVISHPDLDHYLGFDDVFSIEGLSFKRIYTSGLIEQKVEKGLGEMTKSGNRTYCTGLVEDITQLDALLAQTAKIKGKRFPGMLKKHRSKYDEHIAVAAGQDGGGLSTANQSAFDWIKAPGLKINVVGPVREDASGKEGLRWLGNLGQTKNGHSVVLRLEFGNLRLLLSGDLNERSEALLLSSYTGLPEKANTHEKRKALADAARPMFEVDVAKSCHHGSSDVSEEFLMAINTVATVVSSGDNEPHAHPRADTLGIVGRHSRGSRPLIFSTELARSGKEFLTNDKKTIAALKRYFKERKKLLDEAQQEELSDKQELTVVGEAIREIGSLINKYGAINVRSDGERTVVAYKMEESKAGKEWDIYCLEPGADGKLDYVAR